MSALMGLVAGEPLRYPDRQRWASNNGFRRRWLANGAAHAAAINAARGGDTDAVRAHAATRGGLTQVAGWTRSVIAAAQRLPDPVAAYRIRRYEGARRAEYIVESPYLSWVYVGRRQVASITWTPLWTVPIPASVAASP